MGRTDRQTDITGTDGCRDRQTGRHRDVGLMEGYRDRRTDRQTQGFGDGWVWGQTDGQGWMGVGMDRRTDTGMWGCGEDGQTDTAGMDGLRKGYRDRRTDRQGCGDE